MGNIIVIVVRLAFNLWAFTNVVKRLTLCTSRSLPIWTFVSVMQTQGAKGWVGSRSYNIKNGLFTFAQNDLKDHHHNIIPTSTLDYP